MLFARYCAARGLLDAHEVLAGVGWLVRTVLGRIDEQAVADAKRTALRFQMRVGERRASELLDRCFTEVLWPRRRADILRELARRQQLGTVHLVTANLRNFALRWGGVLGIPPEQCHGAEGARVRDALTGALLGPVPIGKQRARWIDEVCGRGPARPRSAAYGDSVFDVPMLGLVDEPCAVYPSVSLRSVARNAGWRIIG